MEDITASMAPYPRSGKIEPSFPESGVVLPSSMVLTLQVKPILVSKSIQNNLRLDYSVDLPTDGYYLRKVYIRQN